VRGSWSSYLKTLSPALSAGLLLYLEKARHLEQPPWEKPRPGDRSDRGWLLLQGIGTAAGNKKPIGYLRGGAGCVITAAWWCQKQPPRPIAAAMVKAKAIKMRIAFPHFCLALPEKRDVLAAVAWTTKQTATVASQPQNCFESRL
jgi:hypothetical protein